MKIAIKRLRPDAVLPEYKTSGSAASDLVACLDKPVVMKPLERTIVPTGVAIQLPDGYEAQVRARSGLSAKHGICLANGIGTIDADYRGEIGVSMINLGSEPFTIEPGMRIAQMAIVKYEQAAWDVVADLESTERGEGGYGSTGH